MYSISSPLAKPPAGSSLLFGALADSGRIKERKNGSYRMVLKGVDEIDWFTDRPYRSEGLWKPQKLIRQWDSFFRTSDPNAQASIEVGEKRELITFEMFKPKYNSKNQRLSFKINAGIINNRENDIITGLKGKALDEVSLFIDDAKTGGTIDLAGKDISGQNLSGANLSSSKLNDAVMISTRLIGANLRETDLTNALLYGTIFIGADMYKANLRRTLMDHDTSFQYAKLEGANFANVKVGSIDFSHTKLMGADFTEARLEFTDLSDANLTGANLTNASLKFADLANADLEAAILDGVKSGNIKGKPNSMPRNYGLINGYLIGPSVDLEGAILNKMKLKNTNLSHANLKDAKLIKAEMYDAGLEGSDLTGATLTEAVLINTNLEDVTWNQTICPDGTMNEGTSPCTNDQLYGWMNN